MAAAAVAGVLAVLMVGRAEQPEDAFRLGLAAAEAGDIDRLTAAIEVLEHNPGYEQHARLLRGARSLRLRDLDVALWHLSRVPPDGELRTPALLLTGECLYWADRLAEAEGVFRTATREFPENPEAHRWLGAIYYDLGAMDHAIAELDHLARLKPDEYQPYRLQGHILSDYERFGEAIEAYQQALERNPPETIRSEIVEALANCLVRERRYSDALRLLEPVPDGSALLAIRAECLWNLGEREEARDAVERAKHVGPADSSLLLVEARMARESGEAAAAIPLLEGILQEDPHDAAARYQLALAYRDGADEQRYEQEIAKYQRSIKLRLKLSELHVEAIEDPNDAELRDEIAGLCTELGKDELAAVWRRAAEACRRAAQRGSSTDTLNLSTEVRQP